MDIDIADRVDWEKRRKIRLTQVRDQSKTIAKTIRNRVHNAVEIQLEQREMSRNKMEQKFKSLTLNKLKSDFNYLIQDIGNGYSVASIQSDPNILIAEKRLINRCKAISRGTEAEKRQKQIQEKQQLEQEMRERKFHFNKTVEKIRSTLITSIQNVDNDNNHIQSITKNNECFLIPSQITLNESKILDWKSNNKTSKPWSMVINSKENHISHFHENIDDENKENNQNIPKFKKLETEVKNYETLVIELNKLSAEEQNIRNKLLTSNWKEVLVPNKKNINFIKQDNDEEDVKNVLDKNTNSNQIKNKITEKIFNKSDSSTSVYTSSSASNTINYKQPVKSVKKTIQFENNIKKKKCIKSNSKLNCNSKVMSDVPLRNINNMLNRIKNKKQLLTKEISDDTKSDIKKSKIISKTSSNRCAAGNDLCKESLTNYAKLPDSFYNCQLKMLKDQFSKKKFKLNDSKNTESINLNLMKYINMLLKMTPSDVDNLSISSCSSVKLEESSLHHSKQNENLQYYNEMLNCISKCLNIDTSDTSRDTIFDSPKNINLLNKFQELTNYYSEKTHEMKNICDESLQVLNEQANITDTEVKITQENSSISISSDSSVDGEYIMRHLHTLLKKKGLIKSDKEWPMFENISDNDDNRSLTDQLLDIYPHRSDNN